MHLTETYAKLVKPCIVAFARKWTPAPASGRNLPQIPSILGTGFVVHADGLIATNRHVVEEFLNVPPEVRKALTGSPIHALLFHEDENGMQCLGFDVVAAHVGTVPQEMLTSFSPEQPDLAFVRVDVRGLPTVALDSEAELFEGTELATAGFPMGSRALMPGGRLQQLSPMLQKGIVSAVLPFPGSHPHGFVLNVMIQGGASGSPVFHPDNGKVAGVLRSRLADIEHGGAGHYRLPTMFSYGLPSFVVKGLLDDLLSKHPLRVLSETPTWEDSLRAPPTREDGSIPWTALE